MRLEPNKYYRTKNGHKVLIIDSPSSVSGIVLGIFLETLSSTCLYPMTILYAQATGKTDAGKKEYDLVEEWRDSPKEKMEKEMNIEVGKFYKTKSGCKVKIYSTGDSNAHSQIHGAILEDGKWTAHSWCSNGRTFLEQPNCHHPSDIVSEWNEPLEVWVNVYQFRDIRNFTVYENKEAADANSVEGRSRCVHLKEVQE